MSILVLGIGNFLRSDDGVGLHVIEALRKEKTGDNIDLMEALSGLDILDAIKGYDRIILVDAIKTGGEPGTIYELSLKDIQNKHTNHSFSTHLNMDLSTMLELGNRLFPGKIPKDIRVIAIEAEDVTTISDKCTPAVECAIPKAVEIIKGLI
ncbi:MAG: hydrogenase maturation protease [Nitrospira sp.]|nr:hydrogenase maturation protease [Nitrospira sp.]